ncbi:DUF4333 domain-containing protein [Nocardiopsis sp. JB363]|uniref:DUF4333 domain-containing protein n=1 Tax=Nocardiopsis sp. JB363 TaxID=1434837 RepID=UPI00097A3806|nr:DUF4333 domain-containing protein [Nocardiopsis sp. JB363]SIO89430.1 hypothetical protein BQ8420_21550 [Nocardiopsis sp. JB363]
MRQIRSDRIIAGAALGALPLLLVGCSFSFGGPSAVPAADVAEESSRMLTEEIGQAPDEVTCADDLPAEVGAEIRCELVDDGVTYGVTVTTTSVEGNDVEWDVVVDAESAEGSASDPGITGDETTEEDGATTGNDGDQASGDTVPATDVAEQSSAELTEIVGQAPDSFTCAEDLPAQVGAEIRCELMDGPSTYGVTITTTSVNGGNVDWDIQVDETPR